MDVKEIEVQAPWGIIAGRLWGDENDPMVLVFHGILDNAASFDRLIPLLPNCFCYAAFDLPGHGKSSHFPYGVPIYTMTYFIAYRLIMDHFGREKYIILGHSYGAQIALFYAQFYPDKFEKIIALDSLHLLPINLNLVDQYLDLLVDTTLEVHEKLKTKEQPVYTYEEVLDRLGNQRRYGQICIEAAEALATRAVKPANEKGKFYFTADQRLKSFINPFHDVEFAVKLLQKFPIKCPVLFVLASETHFQKLYFRPFYQYYKKHKRFVFKNVTGSHDVHNDKPEDVAPHIVEFLLQKKHKL